MQIGPRPFFPFIYLLPFPLFGSGFLFLFTPSFPHPFFPTPSSPTPSYPLPSAVPPSSSSLKSGRVGGRRRSGLYDGHPPTASEVHGSD